MPTEESESAEIRAAILQYQAIHDIVSSHVESGSTTFQLTPDLVLYLHSAGTPIQNPLLNAGFRQLDVQISQSNHIPPV